ncbi:MAG: hypothetical protein II896_06490 [Clostridia bacterium]|nr:hypothetical protein [Clostridia bacterium]
MQESVLFYSISAYDKAAPKQRTATVRVAVLCNGGDWEKTVAFVGGVILSQCAVRVLRLKGN